ncbi:TetR family transcriptional regulator [Agromyces seonyuensis]|uniref:TetR family transcriptional regulator n=1 Tax=Agromyces seonyuensis TaxID=2662446 RepID=A0A6I4NV70_9MICO|nr:TetR family transcriptional regulator [Agromyces seonyuensis]
MTDAESKQDSLRTRRVDSTDTRVLRTREKLVAAFGRLLDERPIAEITVTAVVEAAGVTRSSFYAHFTGVDALAATALAAHTGEIVDLARDAIAAGASKTAVNEGVYADLAGFLAARRSTFGVLLIAGGEFTRALSEGIIASSLETLATRPALHADPEVTARYVAGGVIAVLAWWLADDGGRSVDDLAHAFITIAPPDFRD